MNGDFLSSVQTRSPQETATLDLDATAAETNKQEALYRYKGFKAYRPLNLNSAMTRLVLGVKWVGKRMKTIRFWLIKLPGRVLDHARTLMVRPAGAHVSNEILFEMRWKILSLCEFV